MMKSVNELMTTAFEEQPLALPGSTKNVFFFFFFFFSSSIISGPKSQFHTVSKSRGFGVSMTVEMKRTNLCLL